MAKPLPPFNPEESAKFLFRHGHSGWLGLRYSDHGENWVELELPWRDDLLGEEDRHVLASGPIISLLDMASLVTLSRIGLEHHQPERHHLCRREQRLLA